MRLFFTIVLTSLGLAACAVAPPDRTVTIPFALVAGEYPAACGETIPGLGTNANAAQLSDARFYIHDLRLIDRQGHAVPVQLMANDWQTAGVALLDFENGTGACRGTPATNAQVVGTVPDGRYIGLSFVIGVPAAINHTSTTTSPPPLDLAAMGWSWQAGRRFMKIELDPMSGVARASGRPGATWHLHLGSTGCVGDPVKGEAVTCANGNRIPVTLPAFDPATQQVVLDMKALFQTTDLGHDGGGALGCMSGPDDPDCPGVFRQLGLITPTPHPAAFRAETQR